MKPRILIQRGDISKMHADVIVNAANSSLLGGGGVDAAIHQAAGPELLTECKTFAGCPVGDVKVTKAYNLPAKYVFHTVGPKWTGGSSNEEQLLSSCYANCMDLAQTYEAESIAFPAISTGAFAFPSVLASKIAFEQITNAIFAYAQPEQVILVPFDTITENLYLNLLNNILS